MHTTGLSWVCRRQQMSRRRTSAFETVIKFELSTDRVTTLRSRKCLITKGCRILNITSLWMRRAYASTPLLANRGSKWIQGVCATLRWSSLTSKYRCECGLAIRSFVTTPLKNHVGRYAPQALTSLRLKHICSHEKMPLTVENEITPRQTSGLIE